MKPRDRAIAAFNLKEPGDIVPTFEIGVYMKELLGKESANVIGLIGKERERAIHKNAELYVEVAEKFDYSVISVFRNIEVLKVLKKWGIDKKYLLAAEADGTSGVDTSSPDGTFFIPAGKDLLKFVYWLNDHPVEAKAEAERRARIAGEWGKHLVSLGAEVLTLSKDQCFKAGPFLSPAMFSEFITPYLRITIEMFREAGAYVIKHTDGNIMPVLDQLVFCRPHVLHSLDPMAGVDIAEVKRLVGDKVCLMGNVDCSILESGPKEKIIESAIYCLKAATPRGGYIFGTSNSLYEGIPLENYLIMLEVRNKYGRYPLGEREKI